MRGSSEVRFVLVFTVFFRCRTFGALIARRLEKSRKTAVSDSKTEAPGVLGRLGGASLSAKTAKSSEKTRSKCLRGFRKFISQRKRGNFERESAPSAPEERREARSRPKARFELSLWMDPWICCWSCCWCCCFCCYCMYLLRNYRGGGSASLYLHDRYIQ